MNREALRRVRLEHFMAPLGRLCGLRKQDSGEAMGSGIWATTEGRGKPSTSSGGGMASESRHSTAIAGEPVERTNDGSLGENEGPLAKDSLVRTDAPPPVEFALDHISLRGRLDTAMDEAFAGGLDTDEIRHFTDAALRAVVDHAVEWCSWRVETCNDCGRQVTTQSERRCRCDPKRSNAASGRALGHADRRGMNREALLELAERIEGCGWMMRRFLHDRTFSDVEVALEVLGRASIIEAKLAQIRSEMARDPEPPARNNVHTLGTREPSYRPHGNDAA